MKLFTAPKISENSWLQDPKYDDFRKKFEYATTQTRFIVAANGLTAEDVFWIYFCLEKGPE